MIATRAFGIIKSTGKHFFCQIEVSGSMQTLWSLHGLTMANLLLKYKANWHGNGMWFIAQVVDILSQK